MNRAVRRGALFAVSMVILSVPSFILVSEMQKEITEAKSWLEGRSTPFNDLIKDVLIYTRLPPPHNRNLPTDTQGTIRSTNRKDYNYPSDTAIIMIYLT